MTRLRFANSLRTRLIVFGVLLVISGAAMRYTLLPQFLREDLMQVVSAQELALAETVARDIDYKIEERRHFLEQLTNTLPQEWLDQPARLRTWLEERHQLQPLFSNGLILADINGTVLLDAPPMPGRAGRSIADNPDFRLARNGQAHIGSPIIGPVSQRPILPICAPIKDHQGQVRAVLLGTTALDAPGFLDRLQQQHIGESGGFLLVSPRDHLFIAASDPSMIFKPTPPPGVNLLHDRAMSGFRGSGITTNARGVEEISAMVSVPSTGWFVVARIPTDEAFATVGRVQNYIIRHTFSALLIVLLVATVIISWMLRPLYQAADLADKMTHDEIPLTPLPVVRKDEVGHLTSAFNRLLAKLTSSQAELVRIAHHDALTGLPNRSLLADRMQQALARARRSNCQVAVLFLDLDGFKQINDTLGHEYGDQALQEISRRLLAVVRQADTLARFGGDEFVLLVTDIEGDATDKARTLANKCIAAVAEPLHLNNGAQALGVSIGIAICTGSCTIDRLLLAADKAMYEAKEKGRGCYILAPGCSDLPPLGSG